MPPKKVLILAPDSSVHWDELADAYHAFNDAHWQVDLASPLGHPKVDTLTLRTAFPLHYLGRGTTGSRLPRTPFFGRPVVELIMRTSRVRDLRAADYDVFYVVGDDRSLERDPDVGALLAEAARLERWFAGRLNLVEGHRVVDSAVLRRGQLFGQVVHADHVVFSRSPRKARRVAKALIARMTGEVDVRARPEYLDRKSG